MSGRHLCALTLILPGLLLAALLASPHVAGVKGLRLGLAVTPALGLGVLSADAASSDDAPSLTGSLPRDAEALQAAPALRSSTAGRSEPTDSIRLLTSLPSDGLTIGGERFLPSGLPGHRLGTPLRAASLGARAPPV